MYGLTEVETIMSKVGLEAGQSVSSSQSRTTRWAEVGSVRIMARLPKRSMLDWNRCSSALSTLPHASTCAATTSSCVEHDSMTAMRRGGSRVGADAAAALAAAWESSPLVCDGGADGFEKDEGGALGMRSEESEEVMEAVWSGWR